MADNTTTLYVVPDTNLFIQCRQLKDLDWTAWKHYHAVELLVTPPVQREIDNQKSNGRGRVQKRARETSSLFREIIQSHDKALVIRDANPRVTLRLRLDCAPDPALAGQLDYQERDDQLVGTLSSFVKANPGVKAELLTDDTGPMAKADMVNLPATPIPDDWLLEVEGTNEEKKIRALETELAKLKNAGPVFKVVCLDGDGSPVEKLQYDVVRHQPLTDLETEMLMAELRNTFPIETDFGSSERIEREAVTQGPFRLPGLMEVFEPADPKDIENYREKTYPEWLESCAQRFRSLHDALNDKAGQPAFTFVARNEGARPASDALVTIEALGGFKIIPPSYDDEPDADDSEHEAQAVATRQTAALPKPPKPPRGTWHRGFGVNQRFLDVTRGLAGIGDLYGSLHSQILEPRLSSLESFRPARHDPNAFYYKPSRPRIAEKSFALECDQWRHGDDPESFAGEIHFPAAVASIDGALEFTIHAENLSEPVSARVPVRIQVRKEGVLERARRLIADLSQS